MNINEREEIDLFIQYMVLYCCNLGKLLHKGNLWVKFCRESETFKGLPFLHDKETNKPQHFNAYWNNTLFCESSFQHSQWKPLESIITSLEKWLATFIQVYCIFFTINWTFPFKTNDLQDLGHMFGNHRASPINIYFYQIWYKRSSVLHHFQKRMKSVGRRGSKTCEHCFKV